MIELDLKDEISKYREFSSYMADSTIAGTRVGFVRKLIDNLPSKNPTLATPPDFAAIQMLIDASSNSEQPLELRAAINTALRTISDLQTQVRGLLIEQAETQRRNSLAEVAPDAQVKQEA